MVSQVVKAEEGMEEAKGCLKTVVNYCDFWRLFAYKTITTSAVKGKAVE